MRIINKNICLLTKINVHLAPLYCVYILKGDNALKLLQKLIEKKVREGVSLRQIAKESGVEYTSVNNYLGGTVEPRRGNLKKLSEYFNVPFHALWEEHNGHEALTLGKKQLEIAELASSLSDDEAQLLLDLLRTVRSNREPKSPANS